MISTIVVAIQLRKEVKPVVSGVLNLKIKLPQFPRLPYVNRPVSMNTVGTQIVTMGKGRDVTHQPGRNRNGGPCDV